MESPVLSVCRWKRLLIDWSTFDWEWILSVEKALVQSWHFFSYQRTPTHTSIPKMQYVIFASVKRPVMQTRVTEAGGSTIIKWCSHCETILKWFPFGHK